MLENYAPDLNRFNILFCKYRIKKYVAETADLLTRHKLLFAFIICLLAQGVNDLLKSGLPFFEVIAPTSPIKLKILCILAILAFSIMLTNAQSDLIKGGKLTSYITTFNISTNAHKKIDLIVLIISLNFVWLTIFLGSMFIFISGYNASSMFSLFCLYLSFVIGYLILLLSKLYNNTKYVLLLVANLIFIACISSFQSLLINYGGAILAVFYSCLIYKKLLPLEAKNKFGKSTRCSNYQIFQSIQVYFATQFSSYRQYKKQFISKVLYCFMLSAFLMYLTAKQAFDVDKVGFFITILGFEVFLLSTLFSFFQKAQINYKLFHKVFPYQKQLKYFKEVIFIFMLFLILNTPLLFYLIIANQALCVVIFSLALSNALPFALNRLIYWLSLRLCLFTSLISNVFWIVIQYLVLGVFLEY